MIVRKPDDNTFKPVKLELIFESQDEINALWYRIKFRSIAFPLGKYVLDDNYERTLLANLYAQIKGLKTDTPIGNYNDTYSS